MFELPDDLAALSTDDLTALAASGREALGQYTAIEAPTVAQVTEARTVAEHIRTVDTELAARAAAADELASLAQEFTTDPEPEAEPVAENQADPEPEPEPEPEPAPETQAAAAPAVPAPAATPPAPTLNTGALAGRRPATPPPARRVNRFRAQADVDGVSTGQALTSLEVAETYLSRFNAFPTPVGTDEDHVFGSDPNMLRTFGQASMSKGIPAELTITRDMGPDAIQAVLDRACDDSRLPGGNLVAATGWCAPSDTSYSFSDDGSTTEGLIDLPEVGAPRGGLRNTLGPDWADIYALNNFFKNTEAQVIAGTATKPCFTVTCPTFTDHRLDAYGYCFQIPFLTEAAYPELIQRFLSGSMTAYAHKMNADKIQRVLALLPTAEVVTAVGSLATSLFGRIQLILDRERTTRRWSMKQAVEVKLPMWVMGAIKTDISLRTGTDYKAITDQQIESLFTAANASPSWLYDWAGQDLGPAVKVYPSTFNMMVYRAGTFIALTTDVVNLSSVYDAASLASNIYTGAFFEEGMTVMPMQYGGNLLTVPTCLAGVTGVASVACPSV